MLRYLRFALGTGTRLRADRTRARFLRALNDCRAAQEQTLGRLLRLHAGSDYARENGLDRVRTPRDLQQAVPVSDFERIRSYVERMKQGDFRALMGGAEKPLMFAMSSGTTAQPKFIPITRQYLADYRRSWTAWGIDLYRKYRPMNFLHIVQLASDFDRSRTPGGTPCGNITGLVQHIQNPIIRTMYSVPGPVLKITDPNGKYYAALRYALSDPHVGMLMTANPSTLIHLADLAETEQESLIRDIHDGSLSKPWDLPAGVRRKLARFDKPRRDRARQLETVIKQTGHLSLHAAWPELQLLAVWTAGSAAAYLPRLRNLFPGIPIRDHGLSASEARMTITLEDETRSAALDITSHFFEFIPEDEIDSESPNVLLAHELEADRNYFIILTTSCGLYRYDIHDVVRCTGFVGTTPLLEFLHKGAHISNLTGEKLTESQTVEAVTASLKELGVSVSYFTLAPVWAHPPRYQLLVDEKEVPAAMRMRLGSLVDSNLIQLNCEYADKRQTDRLRAVSVVGLPAGTWARLIRSRQNRPSGSLEQYKHPCLSPSLDFRDRLLKDHGLVEAIPA